MSTYITLLSSIIDNIVLYLYFQTMFEKRKDKVRFYWLILAFLLSDFIFWKITAPFNGDVSNMVTFFRTSLTNLRDLSSLFLFCLRVYLSCIGNCKLLHYNLNL